MDNSFIASAYRKELNLHYDPNKNKKLQVQFLVKYIFLVEYEKMHKKNPKMRNFDW